MEIAQILHAKLFMSSRHDLIKTQFVSSQVAKVLHSEGEWGLEMF